MVRDYHEQSAMMAASMAVALVVHGGGPTQVINASLAGAAEACRQHPEITGFYGARFGIEGVLAEDFIDLLRVDPARMAAGGRAPGSALGSSRVAVAEPDYERILAVCRAHDIRFVLLNGGNGSMYMAHQ